MARLNFASLEEFVPTRGLRVDLMAIGPKSEIWIIECKSGRADFMADKKWQGYLDYCDSFFWAVDMRFPTNILPDKGGLIVADAFDAEILRIPEEKPQTKPSTVGYPTQKTQTGDELIQLFPVPILICDK